MKNSFKYISALLLVFILSACGKDFLEIEPVDRLTGDNFYKTESEIRAATAGLYGFPWFEYNDKFAWTAGDCMPGDMYHTWDQEGQFFYLSFNAGNAHLAGGWRGLYRVISYANSVINDMPRIAAGKVPQAVIDKGLGEARFIRGTAFYLLAEYWGEVPIVENSTELVAANNLILPKNTRTSVLEFARRDLAFAAEKLPISDDPGRVTQWSAKGMLAKLHLTMASTLTDAKSGENFNKAKEYALDVIRNSGLTLMSNYANLFKIENNNNPESLFALGWIHGSYSIGNSRQANWARSSLLTGNSEAWGGYKSVTYDFLEKTEAGDRRLPAIYMWPGNFYPELNKKNGGYTFKIVNRDPKDPNIVIEGAPPLLNALKKYVVGTADDNAGRVSTGQAAGINQYILRLADVYLVYAEAALGAGNSTTDATALQYFNAIRQRAGLSNKTSLTFLDILRERRIEFGLESINWFDIKRYFYRDANNAVKYLNDMKREHTYQRKQGPGVPDENLIDGYTLTPPTNPVVISAAKMWLPVPASEVVANPKLAPEVKAEDYKFN